MPGVAPPLSVIRVVIIEDQLEVRDGLALLINRSEDCRVTQAFGPMEDALDGIGTESADVALVDIGLPGIEGVRHLNLKERHSQLLVLILTVYGDDDRIFQAVCAGACGYELFREFRPPQQAGYRLSPQEARLLKLLGEGHHYKTAAAEMSLSVHTVRFHLKNIYSKLEVHSKSEAVPKALPDRLIR
jgi:DNA-binding NarL/FixJ family response regulator